MTTDERDEHTEADSPDKADKPGAFDPRDTDHPAGDKQAAENAANDPVS